MKKLISVLLTLVMLAGAAAAVFSAGEGEFPFTDVPAKTWYRKAVDDPGSAYTARTALERIESMKAKSGGGTD